MFKLCFYKILLFVLDPGTWLLENRAWEGQWIPVAGEHRRYATCAPVGVGVLTDEKLFSNLVMGQGEEIGPKLMNNF